MLEIIGVSQLNYSVQYIHIRDKKFCVRGLLHPLFLLSDRGRGQGAGGIIIYHQAEDESVCMYVCMYFYVLYNVHTLHTIVVTSTFQLCETVELL